MDTSGDLVVELAASKARESELLNELREIQEKGQADRAKEIEIFQVRISELELALKEAQADSLSTGLKSKAMLSSDVAKEVPSSCIQSRRDASNPVCN